MPLKIINATEMRAGSYILIDGEAFVIKSIDVSKTGKHGHAKVRFEAVGVLSGRKKVMVVPGHKRFDVPMIDKRKGQVLSVIGDKASLMDSDNFENFELSIPADLKDYINDGIIVEYWDIEGGDIEGDKLIKRTL